MSVVFDCWISGHQIKAKLQLPFAVTSGVLCFSLMAPFRVISGGTMVKELGGYGEISIPDMAAGDVVELTLEHVIARHKPANRAWIPLGPYLRHDGGITELPVGPSGAAPWVAEPGTVAPDLCLVPLPKAAKLSGETVSISGYLCDQGEFQVVDRLATRTGLGPFIVDGGMQVICDPDPGLPKDGYRIEIKQDQIHVVHGTGAGAFYAAISLLHILKTHDGQLPLGEIEDAPSMEWRGMHLDCARHFFEPETVSAYIDLLALMKMNRFHWHFADDEAFRLELETIPQIWQKTRLRGEGHILPGLFGGGTEAGGSYSLEFVRELIAQAKELHIEIMPEVEFPAHALALNAAIDGMRDPADNGAEVSVQGYARNSINPAMAKTWEVTGAIIAELAEIFPFEYMHLGCDELPDDTWSGSPKARALMRENGLETTDDLQGWMMEKLAAQVVSLGKKPAAWEEAARGKNGGIGHQALLFSWTGQGAGMEAVKRGYDIVMCPAQNAYLDMAHTSDPDDWGANWATFLPLEQTTSWSPVPDEISAYSSQILGAQGCFWGEFTTSDHELANMIWPRILGVAQSAWALNQPVEERARITSYAAGYQNTKFTSVLPTRPR